MESPDRLNIAALFRRELSRFPRAVALELEDHLAESIDAQLALGKSLSEAREAALKTLGDLGELARDLRSTPSDPIWGGLRMPWQLRLLSLGWVAFGLICLSRVCTESNPTYLTIAGSLFFGLSGSAVGLSVLRRREVLRRWALRFSVGLGLVLVAKSLLVHSAPAILPVAPWVMPVMAAGALLSAWGLSRPGIRNAFL